MAAVTTKAARAAGAAATPASVAPPAASVAVAVAVTPSPEAEAAAATAVTKYMTHNSNLRIAFHVAAFLIRRSNRNGKWKK